MIECRICGKQKDTRRQMHGHLMKCHVDDYRRVSYNMDKVTTGAPMRVHDTDALKRQRKAKNHDKPVGLRLLNSDDQREKLAIDVYDMMYIDDDGNLYTYDDAAAEGWI